jgi:cobalt-precorrin-5B (C1)-methyltransferase
MAKRLRSGFTTGSCAAAAAKGALYALVHRNCPESVEIPFPQKNRVHFRIHNCTLNDNNSATASVIKDAGDDPDVTNRAEIVATVSFATNADTDTEYVHIDNVYLAGGKGIGTVTKPGLAIKPGEPAINPVPRKMIVAAVKELVSDKNIVVTISIPKGEELAEKTLNRRLGIIGGLSILGTTGVVRPVSADAWTATIKASLDVAREAGLQDVVLSTGRTSEKGAEDFLGLPEEAYAMMGDYLEFSLKEASARGFTTVHLSGMWAKIMKAALCIPQTHVRHGALEVADGATFLEKLGCTGELLERIQRSNTAREMYQHLEDAGRTDVINAVCLAAQKYCEKVTGCRVHVYLVNHKAQILAHV